MSHREKGQPIMRILTDEEFLAMVADRGNPEEMNQAMLEMRREGLIQLFGDGTGDPVIAKIEQTN